MLADSEMILETVVTERAGQARDMVESLDLSKYQVNTALLLVGCDHVTLMLASDWSTRGWSRCPGTGGCGRSSMVCTGGERRTERGRRACHGD